MDNIKPIVVFSHGFGVHKDARGLFTYLSEFIEKDGYETFLFDYNEYNPETKELFALPFSEQAKKLNEVLDSVRNKDRKVIIIGHSQGSFIPTLSDTRGVSKVIAISPFFHTNMLDVLRRYTKDSSNEINFTGTSRRKRSDGSVTVIPSEYWKERFDTDVVSLYNQLALKTKLVLINALQDEIMKDTELLKIKYASIINTDGNHDFSEQYRGVLKDIIISELKSV